MNSFDLDNPLIKFGDDYEQSAWTVRHAVEGLQIFGGIGSGKTSGSGRMIALKYLKNNFGGLVLTVKPDEKSAWQEYCKLTGRSNDLIIIEPGGKHCFNFLQYESSNASGDEAITENIVEVLKTVIRASEEKDTGKSDDAFWETALDMLIFNVIDLCRMAYGTLSIQKMYEIVQSIPKAGQSLQSKETEIKEFQKAFTKARDNVKAKIDGWYNALSPAQQQVINDESIFNNAILEAIPDARLLNFLDQFFFDSFKNLSEKTRSIIDFTFSGFLFRLLRDPVYSLFCKDNSTVIPENCLQGKIILINLPVKLYHKVGRDCQILFKYIWQRSMEKRVITASSRPIFLWADEAQHFIHEHDTDFQATARSSKISTVYITQNLPNYYAAMGGQKAEYRVKSFLGTLATKVFHANADIETNKYASELIGDKLFTDPSRSVTIAENFSQTETISLKIDRQVRPEEFVSLKTGGPKNDQKVEGYIHRQGDQILKGQNHIKMKFNQLYIP